MHELESFLTSRKQPFKRLPSLNFRDLDLFRLFAYVEHLGGSKQVSADNRWDIVGQALGFDTGIATQLESSYSKYASDLV